LAQGSSLACAVGLCMAPVQAESPIMAWNPNGPQVGTINDQKYGSTTRPRYSTMYKVLVFKTFHVAIKKWRLQMALFTQILMSTANLVLWVVLYNALSDNTYRDMILLIIFRSLTPMLILYSMKTAMGALITEMVAEKESKMKVVQMVNGVPPSLYWISYLTYFEIVSLIPSLTWTIMLCTTALEGVNPLLIFVMFYSLYTQTFCCTAMFATLCNKVSHAEAASGMIFVLSFVPIGLSNMQVNNLPAAVVFLMGFLPNGGGTYWSQAVIMLKQAGYDWNWNDNFYLRATALKIEGDETFGVQELPAPGYLFLVFLLQTLLWAAFAYWCDQVIQAEHGKAKPLTFFCRPAYICPKRLPDKPAGDTEAAMQALQVHHLTKTFMRGGRGILCCRNRGATPHNAVDDMSLVVNSGELFALLGHNGAGKTTAINCITGMIPSTSGEWGVMGFSGETDIERCRHNLSMCPQDNPMYNELTVDQHIAFFSALRGTRDVKAETEQVLAALGMTEKRNSKCKALSGGQKRRLWVATALVGSVPVVFLDEPTSGMDPSARRELWSLLLSMKDRGRAIVFTTHYLEEADVLADRKAVMAKGKVKAVGTSKELKMQFGTGYHLRIFVQSTISQEQREVVQRLVTQGVNGAVGDHVAAVERTQADDAPLELRFTLPYHEVDNFGNLFNSLEEKAEELSVVDVELAMTSLEDVFMALGDDPKDADGAQEDADDTHLEFQQLEQEQISDVVKLSNAAYAKTLFALRTKQMFGPTMITGVILPFGMTIYGLAVATGFFSHGNLMQGTYAIYPGFIVGFGAMRIVHNLVQEREAKVRHVMLSQGMPRNVYWVTTVAHVGLQILFFTVLICVTITAYTDKTFTSEGRIALIWLAALAAPIPTTLFFYNLSFFFKSEENALKVSTVIVVMVGMFFPMVPNMLWTMADDGIIDGIALIFHSVLSFFNPFYLMGGAMLGCWKAGGLEGVGERMGNGKNFLGMMGEWAVWAPFVGQLCLSISLLAVACWREHPTGNTGKLDDIDGSTSWRDDDVLAEEERVRSIAPETEACLYRDLHHTYFDKERTVRAVRGISLGIKRGECFGLLGPNGAGKTTTLGCLTGEIRPPTSGEVFVAGHSVLGTSIVEAYQHLGNCPQVDPLFPNLSGRKTLLFYGRMKGVPPSNLARTVDTLLQRLGIQPADRDKVTSKYSGGMKRKLSLGIALIGRSDVLFLDEPSAAVDAGAKRLLWQVIKMRAAGRTVIITTHSMEEAEAVCDRIAIQVLGRLRCLGTPLHLKNRYSSGYQVELRLTKRGADTSPGRALDDPGAGAAATERRGAELLEFLKCQLAPQSRLLEAHEDCYLFQLPRFEKGVLSLGKVFSKLQEAKEEQGIEEYTFNQASLEQVFLRFAREQVQGGELESAKSFYSDSNFGRSKVLE